MSGEFARAAAEYEALLAQAQADTGLSDFGPDEFRAGLRVLSADLAGDHGPAANAIRGVVQANLKKRLELLARRAAEPAVADEVIERPVFVIGLPRTGTTALVDMMAQDPAARAPMQWEVKHLVELADSSTWADDPRIEALDEQLRAQAQTNPIVALGLHAYGARLPDECNSFLSMSMWSPSISVATHLPRYSEWLKFATLERPYAMHRFVLQHLQRHGGKGRWTLKSPFHVFDLPGILAEYPDAVFIQTHRDPSQMIASNCGLHTTIRGQKSGSPGAATTAREVLNLWGTGVQRAMAARLDPAIEARVFDVSHRALLSDPMGTLGAIYERFGWDFGAEAQARIRQWNDAPAQHISSVKFSLEDFGLTKTQVDAAFGAYGARYASLL